MPADHRQRRIEEIKRELTDIARTKLPAGQGSDREAALKKELAELQQEVEAYRLLDLPIMDAAVLRGPKRESTGIPTMITMAMRSRLQALGYRDEQIDTMTPSEAWKILEGRS